MKVEGAAYAMSQGGGARAQAGAVRSFADLLAKEPTAKAGRALSFLETGILGSGRHSGVAPSPLRGSPALSLPVRPDGPSTPALPREPAGTNDAYRTAAGSRGASMKEGPRAAASVRASDAASEAPRGLVPSADMTGKKNPPFARGLRAPTGGVVAGCPRPLSRKGVRPFGIALVEDGDGVVVVVSGDTGGALSAATVFGLAMGVAAEFAVTLERIVIDRNSVDFVQSTA